jgi:hypothetical protein
MSTHPTLEDRPAQVLPTFLMEVSFTRLDRENEQMRASASGNQTFVTRMAEAAASAFEEEVTR